ncbi:MAG: efflux RND transporter periplasmic adaptor subunit [Syntrophorhabdales bacterium]
MKIRVIVFRLFGSQPTRFVFLVFLLAVLATGCRGESSSGKARTDTVKPPSKVSTITVRVDKSPRIITLSGFTEPFSRTTPAARVMARVIEVNVREGDRVASERVLARLDIRDLQARRRQAQANLDMANTALEVAQTNLERMQELHELKVVPLATLESVEVAFAQANSATATAKAMLDELDVNLSYAVVRAPSAGVVVRKMTEVGNLAAPGQPLFVVRVSLAQPDVPKIVLPKNALVERGQLTGVFVVEKDATAQLRWLVVGESQGDTVSVLSGLREGDRVILSPNLADVTDGRRVEERVQ